jgi:hypothetical protein
MGGPTSGNFYHSHRPPAKLTVAHCLTLEASDLRREGFIRQGTRQPGSVKWKGDDAPFTVNFEVDTSDPLRPFVRLAYSWTWRASPQPQNEDYAVSLATTRPPFGGLRWWFICPLARTGAPCGRVVSKLHLPPAERRFGCRLCHGLTYASCQQCHRSDALYRRVAKSTGVDLDFVKWFAREKDREYKESIKRPRRLRRTIPHKPMPAEFERLNDFFPPFRDLNDIGTVGKCNYRPTATR